jgi:glycerol-3-phosphate dehydrogenase (NAD(P)+)
MDKMSIANIGVVGSGAWGTALASVAARANTGKKVRLWALENDVVEAINRSHENTPYLPGIELDKMIEATSSLGDLKDRDAVLLVPPAQHLRKVLMDLAPHLEESVPLIICSKGIEQGTMKLMGDVASEAAPGHPLAVLSGPSFAADVAKGLPTAVTLACTDENLGNQLMDAIGLSTFRPYLSSDLTGAEIGGAVKNVIAIACGIAEGCKFGESARAALTARGFAEITRLGLALGAKRETMAGLSGLGDLILTCNSIQSRNMSLGVALGEGRTLEEVMASRTTVAEGVPTAGAVVALAQSKGIEMPIAEAVSAIVANEKTVSRAILDLLSRPFTSEHE